MPPAPFAVRPEHRSAVVAGAGAGIGIAIMVAAAGIAGMPLAAVPFATSIVLVISTPASPQARLANIVGGHLVCTIAGFAVLWLLGSTPMLSALAVGLGVTVMLLTETLHPPAGINGVLVVTLAPPWTYLFMPVLSGALLLAAYAALYRRATKAAPNMRS